MYKWNPAIVRFAEIQKGNKKIQQVLMIKKVPSYTLAQFIYLHVIQLIYSTYLRLWFHWLGSATRTKVAAHPVYLSKKLDSNVDTFSYFIVDCDVSFVFSLSPAFLTDLHCYLC